MKRANQSPSISHKLARNMGPPQTATRDQCHDSRNYAPLAPNFPMRPENEHASLNYSHYSHLCCRCWSGIDIDVVGAWLPYSVVGGEPCAVVRAERAGEEQLREARIARAAFSLHAGIGVDLYQGYSTTPKTQVTSHVIEKKTKYDHAQPRSCTCVGITSRLTYGCE